MQKEGDRLDSCHRSTAKSWSSTPVSSSNHLPVCLRCQGHSISTTAQSWQQFHVLQKKMHEQHSEKWLQKSVRYLTEYKYFAEASKSSLILAQHFEEPAQFVPVPKYKWFLMVYVQDIMSRVDYIKASITSTFGRIIKMDSTKKIAKSWQDTVVVLLRGRPTLAMRWVKC